MQELPSSSQVPWPFLSWNFYTQSMFWLEDTWYATQQMSQNRISEKNLSFNYAENEFANIKPFSL